jgi:hypothetical protein
MMIDSRGGRKPALGGILLSMRRPANARRENASTLIAAALALACTEPRRHEGEERGASDSVLPQSASTSPSLAAGDVIAVRLPLALHGTPDERESLTIAAADSGTPGVARLVITGERSRGFLPVVVEPALACAKQPVHEWASLHGFVHANSLTVVRGEPCGDLDADQLASIRQRRRPGYDARVHAPARSPNPYLEPTWAPDIARSIAWGADAGTKLTTDTGTPVGVLRSATGWFDDGRLAGERRCFELSWSSALVPVEVCVANDELHRRYTGPLKLERSPMLSPARERQREDLDVALYDCVRRELGREADSVRLPRVWSLALRFDADDHLVSVAVAGDDEASLGEFASCIANWAPQRPVSEVASELSVQLRARLASRAEHHDGQAWSPERILPPPP